MFLAKFLQENSFTEKFKQLGKLFFISLTVSEAAEANAVGSVASAAVKSFEPSICSISRVFCFSSTRSSFFYHNDY